MEILAVFIGAMFILFWLLVFCFPIGIALGFKYQDYKKRFIFTALVSIPLIISFPLCAFFIFSQSANFLGWIGLSLMLALILLIDELIGFYVGRFVRWIWNRMLKQGGFDPYGNPIIK